jgi:hypothetical protein
MHGAVGVACVHEVKAPDASILTIVKAWDGVACPQPIMSDALSSTESRRSANRDMINARMLTWRQGIVFGIECAGSATIMSMLGPRPKHRTSCS